MSKVAALYIDPRGTLATRFWSKVDTNGPTLPHRPELGQCWVWTASKDRKGYGQIMCAHPSGKRPQRAHRVAWFLECHSWPELCVLHACDNRVCVRASHLFLGTVLDNNADMRAKGRQASPPGFTPESLAKAFAALPRGDQHYARTNPERLARGERHARTKLTTDQVIEIRRERAAGALLSVLATRFGVSLGAISAIEKRRNWRHVP